MIYKAADECTQLINKNQPEKLINFLRSLPKDVKLDQIFDRDGYSILHMACFSNRTNCLKVLLEKARQQLHQYEIAHWVNVKTTKDEFSALHYASFKGNIQIIQMLMDNGADMQARNMHGLNVLHIAAQGDQPISLYYFKSQGMDIYGKDNRNSTPLHWACFSNSEVALVYLLGWYHKSKLNMRD
jgi:palmitoyltransferase